MFRLGEIKKGWELGYGDKSHAYQWLACTKCAQCRWVIVRINKPSSSLCIACARSAGHSGKKGWRGKSLALSCGGYSVIYLDPTDFFFSMGSQVSRGAGSYVLGHRLVMAKSLGRCLKPWEIVHHRNHIKTDNRIENLQLISELGHKQLTRLEGKIRKIENKLTEQDKLIKLLRWQIKELIGGRCLKC